MIAIVDYGASNIASIVRGLEDAGALVTVATDPSLLAEAAGLVLPGVGSAGSAMEGLGARGLREPLLAAIGSGVPFLGICLGMQLLFETLEEDETRGLGLLPGHVRRLRGKTVPHMGWNTLDPTALSTPLLAGLSAAPFAYFAHSYGRPLDLAAKRFAAASTDAGDIFVSAIAADNLWGTQFHPEKSGAVGATILRNFAVFCASSPAARAMERPPATADPRLNKVPGGDLLNRVSD